jgi:hypothetical protein
MMEWILIALLIIALTICISIYRRSINESRALRSFAILILLHDKVYQTQKSGIIELVCGIKAKDAADLNTKVMLSFDELALRLASSSVGGAHASLWQLKQQLDKQRA